jgi:hypothetical protein
MSLQPSETNARSFTMQNAPSCIFFLPQRKSTSRNYMLKNNYTPPPLTILTNVNALRFINFYLRLGHI